MPYPRKQPCPNCKSAADLDVFKYGHVWFHVECRCGYLGPGEGSTTQAIKSHNERCASAPASP